MCRPAADFLPLSTSCICTRLWRGEKTRIKSFIYVLNLDRPREKRKKKKKEIFCGVTSCPKKKKLRHCVCVSLSVVYRQKGSLSHNIYIFFPSRSTLRVVFFWWGVHGPWFRISLFEAIVCVCVLYCFSYSMAMVHQKPTSFVFPFFPAPGFRPISHLTWTIDTAFISMYVVCN